MAVLNQIREYDPVSFVTAIGDVTLTLRFYHISARGNPRGLPLCDLKLTQTPTDRHGQSPGPSRSDEVRGLPLRDWCYAFSEDALDIWERRMAAFTDVVNLCGDEGTRMFRVNYVQTFLFPPIEALISSHDPARPPERDKYLEREEDLTRLYFALSLGHHRFDPYRDDHPPAPTLFGSDTALSDREAFGEMATRPVFRTWLDRDTLRNLRRLAPELRQYLHLLTDHDNY